MTARFTDHILPADVAANRPAANAVPDGTLFPATDTGIIYQSDGAVWATWATLGGAAYTDEQVRDVMAAALVQGANVSITPDDAGDTITIASTASAGAYHGARVYATATQTAASSAWTSINYGNETFDSDAYHSTASNTSRLTIPTGLGGKYHITGTISYPVNTTGVRGAAIFKNGTTRSDQAVIAAVAAFRTRVSFNAYLSLVAGDYVEIQAYQNSGTALEIGDTTAVGDSGETWVAITYQGA